MRTVLYTEDMEPITVLEIGPFAQEMLSKHGRVSLAVYEPMELTLPGLVEPIPQNFRQVTICGEMFHRNGLRHMMLFTRDEENALLLKSVFLPGQQATVNNTKADAFAKGFLHAIRQLG